jgi:hypothetical protein
MNSQKQRVFEQDRRMELRLRLAAKQAAENRPPAAELAGWGDLPEPEVVARLIARVRKL